MATLYRSYDDLNRTIDDIIQTLNSLDSGNIYEVGGLDVNNNEQTGVSTIQTSDGNVVIDSANKKFYINDGTFTNQGIQLDYNSGSPRLYVGDGSNAYLNFDGTLLTWKAANAELDSNGKLVVVGATIGGWDVDATRIYSTNIILDSANQYITIKDTTFGNDGIQLDYNAGNPRAYIGDGTNEYFQFDGTNLSWKGTTSSLDTSGKLTTTSADIGGWTVDATTISIGSPTEIDGSDIFWKGVNTELTAGGTFTASDAVISGSISAATIDIGGADATSFHVDINGNLWSGAAAFVDGLFSVSNAGLIKAESGTIGGTTITDTKLYGGIISTAENVDVANNGVIMDSAGLRGYDTVLGEVFNLYTDGSAPTFSSGIINKTIFNVDVDGIIQTSATVGDGSGDSAGLIMNASGLFGCETNQLAANANVKLLVDGTFSLKTSEADAITIGRGGSILLDEGGDISLTKVAIPTATTATRKAVAGNLEIGDYIYKVTFYINGSTETSFSSVSNTVTTIGGEQQVDLSSIDTSSSNQVVGRKIYRTKVDDSLFYLLGTIADNTTTVFLDNVDDVTLESQGGGVENRENSTYGVIDDGNGSDILRITDSNTGVGLAAFGGSITYGTNNTAVGTEAGSSLTEGTNNSALGYDALFQSSTGTQNVAIGAFAGYGITSGGQNIAIGYETLENSQNSGNNVAIGSYTLQDLVFTTGTHWGYNTAVGGYSMTRLTSGRWNVSLGWSALNGNGVAGSYTKTVALGMDAGYKLNDGDGSILIGYNTAFNVTDISDTIVIGNTAAQGLTTGDNNIIIGSGAGDALTTEAGNVFLGYQAGAQATSSNTLYIENSNSTTPLIYGEFDNDIVRIYGDLYIGGSNIVRIYGDLYIGGSNKELRFYEGANYVGFEAPALTGNQIWTLPTGVADAGQALIDVAGDGTLSWGNVASSGGGYASSFLLMGG